MARSELHEHNNPTGTIKTTGKTLARVLRIDDHDRVVTALDLLAEGELVGLRHGRFGTVEIDLQNITRWQNAKNSNAERQQRHRDDVCREKAPISNGSVTERNECVTQNEECRMQNAEEELLKPSLSQTESVTPPKRKRRTRKEIQDEINEHRTTLGSNAPLVEQLADLLAEENKTGEVSEGRTLRMLWLPIAAASESIDQAALAYGLQAAIASGAPNANYVKKAAAGFRPAARPVVAARLSETTDDVWDAVLGGGA